MRIGMAGLNGLYWPVAIGNGLINRPGVEFLAAATLGENGAAIKANLGLSPEEYTARFGLRLYDQPDEMIQAERLDTIVIVSRHSQHADWVERLARLGVNIFLPKTFATTLAEADRIVRAQKEGAIQIAVGPSARFLPQMMAVKAAIDADLIGEPFSARICHHHGTIDVFKYSDWYRDPVEGGPELSLGWYGIDLAQVLLGDVVKTVSASYGNFTSSDSPFMDCGRLVMGMRRGGVASFDMYFCNRIDYPSWQLEVVGPKGVISIHRKDSDPYQTIVSLDNASGYSILPVPENTPHWEMFWRDELLAGKEPTISAASARQITLVSLAARDSAAFGDVVAIPEEID
jgi:predicted dehydrogenase